MYSFDVRLTEQDFFEFNKFHVFSSHHSNKSVSTTRITLTVLPVVVWLLTCVIVEFSIREVIARGIEFGFLSVLFWFGTKPFVWFFTKQTLNQMLKKGDRLFSPVAKLEFNEDGFVEITDINRTECRYSAIESIYLVNGKMFYLYMNSIQAYLLPVAAFTSAEQYNGFLDFIQRKSKPITIVNKKR